MSLRTTILTYHSQNIAGHSTADNDHVALEQDLEALHAAGIRIISLALLLDGMDRKDENADLHDTVCLTFDDGCDFDVRDLDYPGYGLQKSFAGILQGFIDKHGHDAQPGLHATTFVIASNEARRTIDARSLFGHGWISDDWWHKTTEAGLISIGNHGWDHNHPDLVHDGANNNVGETRGGFHSVDTQAQCDKQVLRSAKFIQDKIGSWPEFFAYPFGESSDFIRQQFFPLEPENHRCRAALGTDPGQVSLNSNRWNLPRYVCGRDWDNPGQLLRICKDQNTG